MTAGPCEWLAESESLSIQAGDLGGGGERITSVRSGRAWLSVEELRPVRAVRECITRAGIEYQIVIRQFIWDSVTWRCVVRASCVVCCCGIIFIIVPDNSAQKKRKRGLQIP